MIFFDECFVKKVPEGPFSKWCISCDYGTVNPTSMGLWGKMGEAWYRVKEYYYDARVEGTQKTDGEYVKALQKLAGKRDIALVVVDPSAASFLEALRREGFRVRKANNEVLSGIRLTAEALKSGSVVICDTSRAALMEFASYCWDLREETKDQVKKEFDHAMDEIRYFVATVLGDKERDGFSAGFVERGGDPAWNQGVVSCEGRDTNGFV